MNQARISRRDFLKGVATAGVCVSFIVPSSALGSAGVTAPSSRIVMGCIGVGGIGTGKMRGFMGYDDITANVWAKQRIGDARPTTIFVNCWPARILMQ